VSTGPRAARANAREQSTTALPVSSGPREARETAVSCVGFTEETEVMNWKIKSV
jgi:hypothetical protein